MIYFYTRTLLSQEGRLASNLNIPVYARRVSPGGVSISNIAVPLTVNWTTCGTYALLRTIISHEGESKLFILSI